MARRREKIYKVAIGDVLYSWYDGNAHNCFRTSTQKVETGSHKMDEVRPAENVRRNLKPNTKVWPLGLLLT